MGHDMKHITFAESFRKYNNSVNTAIMDIAGVDKDEAKKIELEMDFKEEYLPFILHISSGDIGKAKDILSNYMPIDDDEVEDHIKKNIKKNDTLPEDFYKISESHLGTFLDRFADEELAKILATLEGYSDYVYFEGAKAIKQKIIMKRKEIISEKYFAPGERNRAEFIGIDPHADEDTTDDTQSDEDTTKEIAKQQKEIDQLKKQMKIK